MPLLAPKAGKEMKSSKKIKRGFGVSGDLAEC